MKKLVGVSLAAMLVLAACGGDGEPEAGPDENGDSVEVATGDEPAGESIIDSDKYPEVIATINGEDVDREEFLMALEYQASMLMSQGIDINGEEGAEYLEMIEMQLVEQLVNEQIILQSAAEQGVAATEEEVDAEIEILMADAQIPSMEELEEILAEQNATLDDLRADVIPMVTRNKFLDLQVEEPTVSEEEIQETYDNYVASMEDQEDAEIPSFEDVRDDIETQLLEQHRQQQISEFVQKLREDSDVTIHI